jgi:CubicO group peptidase (beta-lactamase class C family)
MNALQQKLTELAAELDVVGVAAGVYLDGEETYAFNGVTSVENPLPVDADTYLQFGSTGKTYTATAILRLAEMGQLDLDAPVRTYVPELVLRDEDVARQVTVLQLLNHTAGWDGDMLDDTGDGDDCRAEFVRRMERLQQISPLGATVSYNNASLVLAGLVIEKVTGTTYEQAIRDLLLEPLGMEHTLFFPKDVMTRRFAVGHQRHEDGRITVARPWPIPRSCAPAGGMSATAADQIAWARFHLGDGTAPDGTRLLPAEMLQRMKEPTANMRGSALGDYVGISWLLRDIGGTLVAGHGGTTNGQYSEFTMVPERRFALIAMTNSGPNGPELNRALEKWAFEHYLGMVDEEPERLELGEEALAPFAGQYETIATTVEIAVEDTRLVAHIQMKPEARAALREEGDDSPDEQPPVPLALLAGPGDQYVVSDGAAKGMRGYFSRAADGRIDGIHMGGRLATRVSAHVG